MSSQLKLEDKFVKLVFEKNDIKDRYKDEEKQKKIKAFLKEQFNYFVNDKKGKVAQDDLIKNLKEKLQKNMKKGHAAKLLRTIYTNYVEIVIKRYYPNMHPLLEKHILKNSYAHRLNEQKLEQLKLFVGDYEKKIDTDKKKKAVDYLIKNWNNPEFHPFFKTYEDVHNKLIEVLLKHNKYIKIMRLSTSQPYTMTFTYWLHPNYNKKSQKQLKELYSRNIHHKRVNVFEHNVHQEGIKLMREHKLSILTTDNKEKSPYSILSMY